MSVKLKTSLSTIVLRKNIIKMKINFERIKSRREPLKYEKYDKR